MPNPLRCPALAFLVLSASLGFCPCADAQDARPEAAWVNQDAFFFLHVRPAAVWKGDVGATLRKAAEGPAVFVQAASQQMLGIAPDEMESFTFVGSHLDSMAFLFGGVSRKPAPRGFEKDFKDEKKFDVKDAKDFDFKDKKDFKEEKRFDFKDGKDFDVKDKNEVRRQARFGPKDNGPEDMAEYFMKMAATRIITTTKPYDLATVKKALLAGKTIERKVNGKSYYVSAVSHPWGVHFADDRTIVMASPPAWMEKLLARKAIAQGALAPALAQAAKNHDAVLAFNFTEPSAAQIKSKIAREANDPWQRDPMWVVLPLLPTKLAIFSVDLAKESKIEASLLFPDADKAERAIGAAEDAIHLLRLMGISRVQRDLRRDVEESADPGKMMLLSLMLRQLETGLRGAKVTRNQAELRGVAHVKLDINALRDNVKKEIDAILADEDGRRERVRRMSVNNLKNIMLAMLSFHDANKMLPPPAILDGNKKPLLSWRVLLLPYLDEAPLFNQFKLDEPWDSPNNIKLLPKMPKFYAPIGVKNAKANSTYYQVLTGPDAAFPTIPINRGYGAIGLRLTGITDGTSNTIGLAEARDPVLWTKPDDLVYDAKKPLPKMGGSICPDGFNVGMLDGTARFIRLGVPDASLRAAITPQGNERVDFFELFGVRD